MNNILRIINIVINEEIFEVIINSKINIIYFVVILISLKNVKMKIEK